MSLTEDNKDKDQKLLEEYSLGGETGNTIDLHIKMGVRICKTQCP